MAGRGLPVSLGYFLLPLVMVLVGRVLHRERLSGPHKLATALAATGVAAELVRAGGVSWETWLVALGYPLYFALRRRLRTEQLGGHWVDMALALPVAAWFVLRAPSTLTTVAGDGALAVLVLLVGVLSAVALALYMAASGLLPMGLFGLLTYVEPVLLALVAWLLGERLAPGQWPLYGLVFAAVGVLVVDALRKLLRGRVLTKNRG
jgi:chloramphenicol-sensitive protein RarD